MLGDCTARLADDGTITPDAEQGDVEAAHPVVAAAATDAGVLEQIGGGSTPRVALQQGDAAASAALELTASGRLLGGSGCYGWLLGVPGHGSGITQVRTGASTASDGTGASGAASTGGAATATVVDERNARSLRSALGVDVTPVPAGARPTASPAQALATCGGGAVCGKGLPQRFVLGLVSTREGLTDRLASVMQWTGEYCMPVGGPFGHGRTAPPPSPTPSRLVAVIDATTGTPLFSQSGPG